eukprot:3600596-Amphidinium_carterae.1
MSEGACMSWLKGSPLGASASCFCCALYPARVPGACAASRRGQVCAWRCLQKFQGWWSMASNSAP